MNANLHAKKKKIKNEYRIKQLQFVWGWLALPIISWLIFYWYVNFRSFVQAFQDPASGAWSMINFNNVWGSITSGTNAHGSLAEGFINTMRYFLVDIFVKYPIQILVCYFLYKRIKGYKAFRYIFYLPAIISGVAWAGVFKEFISPSGPVGNLFNTLGINMPQNGFLKTPETATGTIIAYSIWLCVYGHMLLLCGAMNRIPIEVLEAARIEGIRPFRELISIILPLIWPTLSTLLLLTCTGILNASGPILLLQPDTYTYGTTTLSYWIFDKVYAGGVTSAGQYNLVSAAGLIMTVIAFPIVMGLRKLMNKIPSVEY